MPLLIGLDVGTSGLKGLAVCAASSEIVARALREYPLYTPAPGYAEQDPEDFVRAALEVLSELSEKLGERRAEVRAVGLSGQMHSAILLDDKLRVIRRAILWCDTRTTQECAEITRALGLDGLRRTVKNRALEGFTLPKLMWLRAHEPEVFARVHTVLMPKDYVALALTGVLGTEVSDASGTLAFDVSERRWSREALGAVNIDPGLFPEVRESPEVLGGLLRSVAAATKLREGLPVVAGAADNAAGAVGLGVVRAGRAMVSLGTSGVVLAHTDALCPDPELRLHGFCSAVPGGSYAMGVMLCAGGALRWYRDAVARRPYEEITAEASLARRGSGGLVFLPYLMGERTPHNDAKARGAFVGLSAATGSAELSRAVLEGISFGLADSLALIRAVDPEGSPRELRLTGGGAQSPMWRQMLAEVLGAEVTLTSSTEGAAFGAAALAAVGAGLFARVEDAADAWVRVTERLGPEPEAVEFYQREHARFQGIYRDLRERFTP